MQIPLYIYAILFCLLVALANYKFLRVSALAGFLPFIFLTLLVELVAVYYKYNLDQSNAWLYNSYLVIQVAFFTWLYYQNIENPRFRQIIRILSVLFFGGVMVTYIFLDTITSFNPAIFVIGGIIITLFAVLFLLYFFSLENIVAEDKLYPLIYVTIGIVAYFAVCSLTITLYKYLKIYNLEIAGTKLYNLVPRLLSIFMYLIFAYSFYVCRRKKLTY
jgi:hypothetical protein